MVRSAIAPGRSRAKAWSVRRSRLVGPGLRPGRSRAQAWSVSPTWSVSPGLIQGLGVVGHFFVNSFYFSFLTLAFIIPFFLSVVLFIFFFSLSLPFPICILQVMTTTLELTLGPAAYARARDIHHAINHQAIQAWLRATECIPQVRKDGPPPGVSLEWVLQHALAIGLTGMAAQYGLRDLQFLYLHE